MNDKIYKCNHCGRNLKNMGVHKCKGGFRKKNLSFKDRRDGKNLKLVTRWVKDA